MHILRIIAYHLAAIGIVFIPGSAALPTLLKAWMLVHKEICIFRG